MVFFFESLQNKRARNEDSYCHMDIRVDHEATVNAYVVADGMGGLSAGNQYSKSAISIWYEELVKLLMGDQFRDCSLQSQIQALKDFSSGIFHMINQQLYEKGMNAGKKGGTTLSTAIFFWDTWIFANVGDSPIYILKRDGLELISELQNVAWNMVREGKTQVGSMIFKQSKNRLLEYLGRREEVHPHCVCVSGKEIEVILLGSDGAFGNLPASRIENILKKHMGESLALTEILEMSRDQGETDNQTAILIYSYEQERQLFQPMEEESEKDLRPTEEIDDIFIGVEGKDYFQLKEPRSLIQTEEAQSEESLGERFRKMFAKRRL